MKNTELLALPPMELLDYLESNFCVELPYEISTTEDMEKASRILLRLSNEYSYMCSLLSFAKIATREMKRLQDKELYEDMVDRKEIIQNTANSIQQKYAAVSRAVGIKMENNAELRMTGNGYISKDRTSWG